MLINTSFQGKILFIDSAVDKQKELGSCRVNAYTFESFKWSRNRFMDGEKRW